MNWVLALLTFFGFFVHVFAFGDDYQVKTDVPVLINGSVVDRKDYPAIIWIGNCTATLVGPRTVATAAHCTGSTVSFNVGSDKYTARCRKSTHYRNNATADYSFCYTDREVVNVAFDPINIDPTYVSTGDWLLQTGFGCTRWGGRLDMQLRVGRSKVISVPSGTNNDITTGGEGSAVLCSGDSGGPAYGFNEDGKRGLLVSVNSRSNTTSRSYLSALATSQGLQFINSFADEFSAKICGLHQDTAGCRGMLMAPVEFILKNSGTELRVVVEPGEYSPDKVRASLESVGF